MSPYLPGEGTVEQHIHRSRRVPLLYRRIPTPVRRKTQAKQGGEAVIY